MDEDRVGRGKLALNGSKSSSSTNLSSDLIHQHEENYVTRQNVTCRKKLDVSQKIKFTYFPSTSSSLKLRYSETLNCSTLSSFTLTRTNSQTPGLGRTARATNGGRMIASWYQNHC